MDHKKELGSGVDPKYKDTFDAVAVGLAHVDLSGKFIRVNDSLCHFLGYPNDELLGLTFRELSLPEDLPESLAWIKGSLAGEIHNSFSKVKRYRHKDGSLVWAKLTTTLMKDSGGQPDYFISSIQDIADLKKTEAALDESLEKLNQAYGELKEFSLKDSLTGVSNMDAFRQQLLQAFERYKRHHTVSTLMFIDVDKFKDINDQYGHLVGDSVLKNVAAVLLQKSRATDVVARYGGDEFAVLMTDSMAKQAMRYGERVGHSMMFDADDIEAFSVDISFGVCEINTEFNSVEEWLEQADKLMYQNKKERAEKRG